MLTWIRQIFEDCVCLCTEAACLLAWSISSLMSDRFLLSVSPSMLSGFIRSMRRSVRCSTSSSLRCASFAVHTGNTKCYQLIKVLMFLTIKRSCWPTCSVCVSHQLVGLSHCVVGVFHHRRRIVQLLCECVQLLQCLLQAGASCCSLKLNLLQGRGRTWWKTTSNSLTHRIVSVSYTLIQSYKSCHILLYEQIDRLIQTSEH